MRRAAVTDKTRASGMSSANHLTDAVIYRRRMPKSYRDA